MSRPISRVLAHSLAFTAALGWALVLGACNAGPTAPTEAAPLASPALIGSPNPPAFGASSADTAHVTSGGYVDPNV